MNKTEKLNRVFGAFSLAFVVLLMVILMGALKVKGPRCETEIIDTDNEAWFVEVGRNRNSMVDLTFNRHTTGTASAATLTLEFCVYELAASCQDLDMDSTGNSVPDDNVLTDDDTNVLESGIRGLSGFNYLRVTESGTFDVADIAAFTICRRAS